MNNLNEIERGQLCQSTIESLYEATGGLKSFPELLKRIISNKAWERRVSKGKVIELASLRELITEQPVRGWGEDPKQVESVIKDDPEALVMFREAMLGQPGRPKESGDIVPKLKRQERSNSRAYSIDRVQRQCDEATVAAVMTGELSPNAALVKAGIRENRQIYLPRDPEKAAKKLRQQFGDEFVVAMARAVEALIP